MNKTNTLQAVWTVSNAEAGPSGQPHNRTVVSFEEALEKTGFGVYNCFLIFIGGLALGNVLLEAASVGFILPVAECDLSMSNTDKGVLSAIAYVGIIVSSHLWGFLADTKGRRAVILPSLLVNFVVTIIASFSYSFWMLVLLRFINGFFISGASATIYAYVGEFHSERNRSRALMGSSLIFAVLAMIMPIIAWGIINQSWSLPIPAIDIVYKPWRLFMIICGTAGLLCGLCILVCPESPKFLLSVGKNREALEVLKKVHRWNFRKDAFQVDEIIPENDTTVRSIGESPTDSSNFTVIFIRTMWDQTVPLFRKGALRTTVIICTIQFWMFITVHGMFMWFPYIVNTVVDFMNHNPGNSSLICDVVYANQALVSQDNGTSQCDEMLDVSTYLYTLYVESLYVVSYIILAFIINRVMKTRILCVILVVFGICGVVTVVTREPQVTLVIYVLFIVSGTGVHVLAAITSELYPTHLRGMALCISLMFGRLGGVVGANMGGFLLDDNCELMFYIPGIALIACGLLALLIPKRITIDHDR